MEQEESEYSIIFYHLWILYNSPMKPYRYLLSVLALFFLLSLSASAQPAQPISIFVPGENSQLISPIDVHALIQPGEDGLVRLTLIDRHQNLLARQLINVGSQEEALEFSTRLPFEIPIESITAMLTITTQDDRHRPLSLRSVKISLIENGEALLEPGSGLQPWLSIAEPAPGAVINTPPLRVSGTVIPVNNNPVIFELLNERGKAIISKQLVVGTVGSPLNFEVDLNFLPVNNARDMRLVVRQSTGFPELDAILDSLAITITP
jgi:hypothetical protein